MVLDDVWCHANISRIVKVSQPASVDEVKSLAAPQPSRHCRHCRGMRRSHVW